MELTFNEYQDKAWETALYSNFSKNIIYPTLGLVGEAGEIANKVKKIQRDYKDVMTLKMREDLIDELGDVLWYVAALATELAINLELVATRNLKKVDKRRKENKIKESRDNK